MCDQQHAPNKICGVFTKGNWTAVKWRAASTFQHADRDSDRGAWETLWSVTRLYFFLRQIRLNAVRFMPYFFYSFPCALPSWTKHGVRELYNVDYMFEKLPTSGLICLLNCCLQFIIKGSQTYTLIHYPLQTYMFSSTAEFNKHKQWAGAIICGSGGIIPQCSLSLKYLYV